MNRIISGGATLIFSASIFGAADVRAQTDDNRPKLTIFEGAPTPAAGRQSLDLSVPLVAAYDDNLQPQSASQGSSIAAPSRWFTSVTPGLTFESNKNRVHFAANAGSSLRYYTDLHEWEATGHSVGAGLSAQLSRHTSLFVNQAASYSPAFLYGLFAPTAAPGAGAVIPPATDYALNGWSSYAFMTSGSLTQSLSQRATVSFNASIRYTDFVGDPGGLVNLHATDTGGRLSYSVSRDIKLRLGYTYRQADYAGRHTSEHIPDIGIEYNRALSRTRRTRLSFSVGPTVTTDLGQSLQSETSRRLYRLVADALLSHQMGRTWTASASAHRGYDYIEGFPNPVFTNAFSASTGGLLNRRTDLSVSGAYSTGETVLLGDPAPFTTYTADVRVRAALTRHWATYAEYIYYYYDLNQSLPTLGLPPSFSRNGVRFGLMLWVPLMRRR